MARPLRIARVNRVDRVVHRLRPGRAAVSVVAVTLLLATSACSSDDTGANDDGPAATGDTGSTDDTTVSPAVVDQLAEWSDRGPHGVGSVQLDLAGRRTVVWYPAEEGAGTEEPLETFDITGLLSPELQAEVPADMRVQHPIAARPGAEPATGGPFPVVLFSHGFAGFPEQSASLTTHLASWGYVVAATDHVERSLSGLLGTGAQGVDAAEDDEVLSDLLDLVALQADDPTSPLAGLVDLEHVAATGHSAGPPRPTRSRRPTIASTPSSPTRCAAPKKSTSRPCPVSSCSVNSTPRSSPTSPRPPTTRWRRRATCCRSPMPATWSSATCA